MTEILNPSDFVDSTIDVTGVKLIKPKLQRPAIPATPVDAVLVPPPSAQPAFDEFLKWVEAHIKQDLPEPVDRGKYRVLGWSYQEPVVFPDRSTGVPFVEVVVGRDATNRVERRFEVGALAWVDLDESGFWVRPEDGRYNFAQSRTNDAKRNMIERVPDEDGN